MYEGGNAELPPGRTKKQLIFEPSVRVAKPEAMESVRMGSTRVVVSLHDDSTPLDAASKHDSRRASLLTVADLLNNNHKAVQLCQDA